jgi:hypothetical protein
VLAPEQQTVIFKGETLSIMEIPADNAAIIKEERTAILLTIKIDDLVIGLANSNKLIYCAHCGVYGYGELRKATTEIHSKLHVLSGECVLALSDFARSSGAVLATIKNVFTWLAKGKLPLAVKFLESAGETAAAMATKSEELAGRFQAIGDDCLATLGKVQVTEAESQAMEKKIKAALQEHKIKLAQTRDLQSRLETSWKNMNIRYEEAKEKESKAEEQANKMEMIGLIMGPIGAGLGALAGAFGARTTSSNPSVPPPAPPPAPPPVVPEAAQLEQSQTQGRKEEEETEKAEDKFEEAAEEAEEELAAAKAEEADEKDAASAAKVKAAEEALEKLKKDHEAAMKAANGQRRERMEREKRLQAAIDESAKRFMEASQRHATAADRYNKEKKAYLESLLEIEKQQREESQKVIEYNARISLGNTARTIAEQATDSLFLAIGALKQVEIILRNNSMFWRQMAAACAAIKNHDIVKTIRIYEQEKIFDPADYFDDEFKLGVVRYYASWRAIQLVSLEYGKAAAEVKEKIAFDFKQNPNLETSRARVKELAAELGLEENKRVKESEDLAAILTAAATDTSVAPTV